MIAYRRALPFDTALRPLLDLQLQDRPSAIDVGLVDSGAQEIRLSAERARLEGIALPPEPNGPDVIAGGVRSHGYRVRHRLRVALEGELVAWTAEVCFCDPWPHPFGLLGQRGFFDAFDVLFAGRERQFRCTLRGDSPA